MDSIEEEPFLIKTSNQLDQESLRDLSSQKFQSRRRLTTQFLIHLGIFILYCTATYAITSRQSQPRYDEAFTGLSVKQKWRLYDKFNESPYAGEPSPVVDGAWHNLMTNMSIRVTKEELDAHGQTSVALPGGGYLAWLGVFHELHCVKMLRQWSYREHYHPNITSHEHQHLMVHIDHCIDWLRNAAMCHADTSAVAVFKWDKSPHPMLNTKRVVHRCVDWDLMMQSHQDRLVSHEEVVSMVNPSMSANEVAGERKPLDDVAEDNMSG